MRKAFTLVEIMLAMSLMVVMTGLVTTRFVGYNQKQQVQTAGQRLSQVFIEAKSNSVSGKIDCSVCGCTGAGDTPLTGWQVVINTGANSGYTIRGVCGGSYFNSRSEVFPGVVNTTIQGSSVIFFPQGGTNLVNNMYVDVVGKNNVKSQIMVTVAGEVMPPIPTSTTMPPGACVNHSGKCVVNSQVCSPSTLLGWHCPTGKKCVPVSATCI